MTSSIYDSATYECVLDRLCAGESLRNVARDLGLPHQTLDYWRRRYHSEKQQRLRTKYRDVFSSVMNIYYQIRGTIGNQRAFDYGRVTGGMSAQYATFDLAHAAIDFTADVVKAAQDGLNTVQFQWFQKNLQDGACDMSVQSEAFMRLQEKLGTLFMQRQLFPIRDYFKVVKR